MRLPKCVLHDLLLPALLLPALLLCLALPGLAQSTVREPANAFSRLNTFSAFTEYSNDSSHIILGDSENRKIGALGFQYQRRLVNRPWINLSYTAELRPGMIESDPTATVTEKQTSPVQTTVVQYLGPSIRCRASSVPYTFVISAPTPTRYTGVDTISCSRRSVIEQGFSPAGIRLNLLSRHRLQPTFSTFAGYMFSTQPVPVSDAGSFNFTFEFGGGLELFLPDTGQRPIRQSVRLEYQVQHFSNKYTANDNPGVDSGFIKLTYAFGH